MAIFMDIELVVHPGGRGARRLLGGFRRHLRGRDVVPLDRRCGHGRGCAAGAGRARRGSGGARALLDLLAAEAAPVSFHVRLHAEGPVVLAKARPR